ncbi:HotDog domain-containing protein [Aspergillus caelatus]|uniref:HotDog domain-containing protein n=1 Tax=Aspergillus caelatus TaxID=61420 RepID=A0A5N7A124_9EURO|nr:HotDog domain-containing protein [Aspergillus caelatus]KAE8363561.1 HotDog domain-containing protein [Aspergillus caelatus]
MSTLPRFLALNTKRSYNVVVQRADLASEIALDTTTDKFPRVLATSKLIAFMEIAAARLLQSCLDEKQLSVGTRVDVAHSAPTPVGGKVTATAEFVGTNGKIFQFEVVARDEAGEIGRGTHERAIVDVERLEGVATKRSIVFK